MICNYLDFLEESYLDSNFAPLYHKTNTYDLYHIPILRSKNIIIYNNGQEY